MLCNIVVTELTYQNLIMLLEHLHIFVTLPGGGVLGQVSYGGVQLRGPNPYPILGKAGLRKHTLL